MISFNNWKFPSKKLHWFTSSIKIYSLFINLENCLITAFNKPTLPKSFKSWLTFPESLSTYKISDWLTSSFLRNCSFNLTGREYFWPHHTTNFKITFHFPSLFIYMQNITLSDQIALEIWIIYESCTLISQEHSHPCNNKNLQTTFHVSWIYIYIPKIKLIRQFLLEI